MSITMEETTIKSGASSVVSARELLEERAHAAAAALTEKMRAKAAERAAAATVKAAERAVEKARKEADRAAAAAVKKAEKEAEKARKEAEKEAEKARKKAEKEALPKRPRGRPKKVTPDSEKDDDFESVAGDSGSEAEVKPCPPAPAPSRTDFGEEAEVEAATVGFAALREPTPMRHIASLRAENAALRARLERAEAALAAIRAALP